MSSDFAKGKKVLSDTDKERFLCCYLNSIDTNAINWEQATKDFGSASVQSFKKMIQNALKKIKDAPATADDADGEQAAEPKAKATPKKRKGKNADADAEESPKKKGKAGGVKEEVE